MRYTCTACITIDSVMKMNKKNYPQVYLDSDSNSQLDSDSEELMSKLEFNPDSK